MTSPKLEKSDSVGQLLLLALLLAITAVLMATGVQYSKFIFTFRIICAIGAMMGFVECIAIIAAAWHKLRGVEGKWLKEGSWQDAALMILGNLMLAGIAIALPLNLAWIGMSWVHSFMGDALVYFGCLSWIVVLVYKGRMILRNLLPAGLQGHIPCDDVFRRTAYQIMITTVLGSNLLKFVGRPVSPQTIRFSSIAFEVLVTFIAIDSYLKEFHPRRPEK